MEFGAEIDHAVNAKIIALYKKAKHHSLNGITEMIPTFRSLMVLFDPEQVDRVELQQSLLSILDTIEYGKESGRHWTLPVCYDAEFGPDMADVAEQSGLSTDEVRNLHAQQSYFVYMIGFLPGYGYMGDLPEPIRLPRRTTPRTRVPRGSVAIAKDMTAVYPLESPGGWHLIGRTPIRMFNPSADEPVLLAPGDQVSFKAISSKEYSALEREVAAGVHALKAESSA